MIFLVVPLWQSSSKKCTLPGTLRAELRRGEARWMHGGKCDDFVEWLFVNDVPTNYLHQRKNLPEMAS